MNLWSSFGDYTAAHYRVSFLLHNTILWDRSVKVSWKLGISLSYLSGVDSGGLQYCSKVSHEQPVLQHSSATPLFDRGVKGTSPSKGDISVWKESSCERPQLLLELHTKYYSASSPQIYYYIYGDGSVWVSVTYYFLYKIKQNCIICFLIYCVIFAQN